MNDLTEIREKLRGIYTAAETEQWIWRPNPVLNGERAIDLIEHGCAYKVHQAVDALLDSVYI